MSKTTVKDFKLFKEECQKWIDLFQLNDWEIHFIHEKMEEYIGYCLADVENRQASIILGVNWDNTNINKKSLDKTAFHEVIELFLAPYFHLAKTRAYSINQHTAISHQIIRTLEHVVFENFVEE